MKPKILLKAAAKTIKMQSPNILTAFGIGLGVVTVIFAVDEIPKAKQIVAEEKEKGTKKVDIAKKVAPVVAKTAVAGAGAIGCVVMSNRINAERIATLSAAYNMSQTAMKEYQKKVKDTIGEEKEAEVRKEVAKDHFTKMDTEQVNDVVDLGGDTVFRDVDTGAVFITTVDAIEAAVNKVNYRMACGENPASLSDIYDELELPHYRLAEVAQFDINEGSIQIEYTWTEPYTITKSDGSKMRYPCCEVDFFGYGRTQKLMRGYGDLLH